MTNESKTTDGARTPAKPTSSLLTKARIALLLLMPIPSANQPAATPLPVDIIVVRGSGAEVDDLALTQRCSKCTSAVVLYVEFTRDSEAK